MVIALRVIFLVPAWALPLSFQCSEQRLAGTGVSTAAPVEVFPRFTYRLGDFGKVMLPLMSWSLSLRGWDLCGGKGAGNAQYPPGT